jgi:hypothetical protein
MAVKCPACGSHRASVITLSLIKARYFKCDNCVVIFREAPSEPEEPDFERFHRAFVPPESSS